jgi:MFS family permease
MSALLFLLIFCLGMLSMGLQLVASRVVAPFFGSSIFVWASLITTFLAAFSVGSFLGGLISVTLPPRQRMIMGGVMAVCCASLIFNSLACYTVCDWLDLQIESLALKLILTCLALYFIPVTMLSTVTPVCIAHYDRFRKSAGRSAGLLNGISTLGNIVGVLISALVLIPNFGLRHLLHFWWLCSCALLLPLWFVLYSPSLRSARSASDLVLDK